jgi:hypothetical protein
MSGRSSKLSSAASENNLEAGRNSRHVIASPILCLSSQDKEDITIASFGTSEGVDFFDCFKREVSDG